MIRFEKAAKADALELKDIQVRAFDENARQFPSRERDRPPGYDSVQWQTEMMDNHVYYKMVAQGRIIGGFIVKDHGRECYELVRIFVDPTFQNKGIGAQAVAFMESLFPSARKWRAETPAWATCTHHFFEKMGFEKIKEGRANRDNPLVYYYEKK